MVYILTGGSTCLVVVPMYMCSSKQWPLTCSYKKFNVLNHNISLKTNSTVDQAGSICCQDPKLSFRCCWTIYYSREESLRTITKTCARVPWKLRVLFVLFLWRIPGSLGFCLDYFYDRDKQPLSVTYTDWTD